MCFIAAAWCATPSDWESLVAKARPEFFMEALPTSTTVVVESLARSDYLIQAIAAVKERLEKT
jgi:hypothetical protein